MKKFGMLWLFAGVFVCVIIALMFLRKHQPPASSKMSSAAVARANGLTEKAGRSSKRYSDMIENPNAMMGTFESYSPSGVLTYSYGSEGQGTGKGTLLVGPSTKITLDGDPAQVTDLKREMNICFLQKESGTIIGQIDAFTMLPDGKLHTLQGPADTVESDELVFLAGHRDLFPCAVTVTPSTTITVDGKPAKISDVKHRMFVVVGYINNTAQSVAAATWMNDDKPHHVVGNLYRISDKQVVIHAYGKDGFDVALTPGPDMKVIEGSSPGALADLHLNEYVTATYTRGIISEITVKTADLH